MILAEHLPLYLVPHVSLTVTLWGRNGRLWTGEDILRRETTPLVHGNAAGSGQLGLTESGLTLTPASSLPCASHLVRDHACSMALS